MWAVCSQERQTINLDAERDTLLQRVQSAVLTVDGEIVDRCHGADWVADSALVGAMVGTVNRLYEYSLIACREGCSVISLEELTALHPFSCDDGA